MSIRRAATRLLTVAQIMAVSVAVAVAVLFGAARTVYAGGELPAENSGTRLSTTVYDVALVAADRARKDGRQVRPRPWKVGRHAAALPIVGVNQQRDHWCWAAVISAVAEYYGKTYDQCGIVTAGSWLGQLTSDCPDIPGLPTDLTSALDALSIPGQRLERPLSFAELRAQVDAGRPVIILMTADGDPLSGHAMLLRGYRTSSMGAGVLLADSLLDPNLQFPAAHTRYTSPVSYRELVKPASDRLVTGQRPAADGGVMLSVVEAMAWSGTILVAPPGKQPRLDPAPVPAFDPVAAAARR